jgi:hypothetical protein
MIVGEAAGLEGEGAQLGDAAATTVVEVHKRKAGTGHRILQERDRRRPRQAMLAAQPHLYVHAADPLLWRRARSTFSRFRIVLRLATRQRARSQRELWRSLVTKLCL